MKELKVPDTEATDAVQAASKRSSMFETNDDSTSGSTVDSIPNSTADSISKAALDSSVESKAEAEPAVALEAVSPSSGSDASSPEQLKELIVEQLKTVFDPEIPVNIYEMGLIYDIDVDPGGATRIRMTLTTPMCPAAEELPSEVETKARLVEGVTSVQLDLVWEPPWTPDMMSESARLDLGMM